MVTTDSMTISQLARDVGVNVETVRYYERVGLMRQPRRPARGWRRYDLDAKRRLRFIRRAQRLGFTLDEIKELLSMRGSSSPRSCSRVRRKARGKLEEIEGKIRDLQSISSALERLAGACLEDDSQPCPILTALDTDPSELPNGAGS